jgi:hypothetical protein
MENVNQHMRVDQPIKTNDENQQAQNTNAEKNSPFSEIDELELRILELRQELRAKQNQSRSYFRISIVLGIVFFIFLFWASQNNGVVLWFLSVLFAFMALLMFIASLGARLNEEKAIAEIEAREARKRILSRFDIRPSGATATETPSYFDKLVRINIENLAEYYSLIKVHTNNSFRISAISGVVGFLLIVIGLVTGFANVTETQYLAYVITGAGILIEFISGIFFYLYNRTIRELKGYHDSLLVVQNILLSFKIIEEITDDQQKATMLGKMLEFLMTSQFVKSPLQNTTA